MPLTPGDTLGPYTIAGALGAGGMGEVYRASDPKLRRDVAIKVLPESVAASEERLARFEREAQILAALNHPHIAAIYGMERDAASGAHFLVLELVEGETLADRLARGSLPPAEAFTLALQIADGLEAAHERGIVHRDLKPANVRVTPDGVAKLLDFGLGKSLDDRSSTSHPSLSPTMTTPATVDGVILGTAAYMSPEQAKGKPVDRRADVWSFGVVLWEMLAGRPLFQRETVSETLAAVLTVHPDVDDLGVPLPPPVARLLRRCLERDPRDRLRDVGDARLELQDALAGGEAAATADRPRWRPAWIVAVGIALLAGLGLGTLVGRGGEPASAVERLFVSIDADWTIRSPQLSPTGDAIVFAARPRGGTFTDDRLFVRRLDAFDPIEVPGSNLVSWFGVSPDGRWLAWEASVAPGSRRTRLWKARADGSTPGAVIADLPADAGDLTWLDGETIAMELHRNPRAVARVSVVDGSISDGVPFSNQNELNLILPVGDGRTLLATQWIYSEEIARVDTVRIDATTGEVSVLMEHADNPSLSRLGFFFFSRGGTVFARPFDAKRRTLGSPTVAVLDGVWRDSPWDGGRYDVADDGTMLYRPATEERPGRRIVLVDREGTAEDWIDRRGDYRFEPAVSEDGTTIAVTVTNPIDTAWEIHVGDLAEATLRPLVDIPGQDADSPALTRDGRWMAYQRVGRDATGGIDIVATDGSSPPRTLLERGATDRYFSVCGFTPDGGRLLATMYDPEGYELLSVPTEPGGEVTTLIDDLEEIDDVSLSPDGRWLAYGSARTGRLAIYARRLGDDGTLGPEVLLREGAYDPVWRPGRPADALELYFLVGSTVHSASFEAGRTPRLRDEREWFDTSELLVDAATIMPDGRVLAVLRGPEEDPGNDLRIVRNAAAEIRALFAR